MSAENFIVYVVRQEQVARYKRQSRRSMLDISEASFERKNSDTRVQGHRPSSTTPWQNIANGLEAVGEKEAIPHETIKRCMCCFTVQAWSSIIPQRDNAPPKDKLLLRAGSFVRFDRSV